MKIVMIDRLHRFNPIVYPEALAAVTDRADNLYQPSDIFGNGLEPDTFLTVIYLPKGEQATFTASHWKIIFAEE